LTQEIRLPKNKVVWMIQSILKIVLLFTDVEIRKSATKIHSGTVTNKKNANFCLLILVNEGKMLLRIVFILRHPVIF
jgi:hypothetical protein